MELPKVFVIMPFSDDFFESYEMLKEHFKEQFDFLHAGEEDNQQNILADIIPPIFHADIILADLTGLNPNVMYELGIAHGFNKKTIIITRDDLSKLPFDLTQYRAKDYSTHFKKFNELISYLDKNFQGAVDGSVVFSNPVNDFVAQNKIQTSKVFESNKIAVQVPDGESGFLDFLAGIEESTNKMNSEISGLSSDMQTVDSIIKQNNSEIERVSKNGGNSSAIFMRKQLGKTASAISDFSTQLNARTKTIQNYWIEIEKNTLGLLENDYASADNNKESLTKYIVALHSMSDSITASNQAMATLRESSLKKMGLQRSLNQAIRFLSEDISGYLSMTEQIKASIEKIIGKSRLILGTISFDESVSGSDSNGTTS